jgi:hypothetical protein
LYPSGDRRGDNRCGWQAWLRSRSGGAALDHFNDLVALLLTNGAQLILQLDPMLATESHQILALHVEFARQLEHAHFLFLQAELLYGHLPLTPSSG